MTRVGRIVVLAFLCIGLASLAHATAEQPVAVSPGGGEKEPRIEQRCPTFSWAALPAAEGYELEVFRAPPAATAPPAFRMALSDPFAEMERVLHVVIAAQANVWTPASEQCLEWGGRYVWHVRELSARRSFAGDWSKPSTFRVESPQGRPDISRDDHPDDGGGEVEASTIATVLSQLAAMREQMESDRAWLADRLDSLQADVAATAVQLNTVIGELEAAKPCTPERWRNGLCSVLEVEATVCFTLALGGEVGAEFAIEPGMEISGGGSWHEVPHVELKANLEAPMLISPPLPLPPIPIVVPDIAASVKAGVEGGIEICIAKLSIPLSPGESLTSATFVEHLVATLEARSSEIAERVSEVLTDRGLDGDRIPGILTALRNVRGGGIEAEEPLQVLRQGQLRDLIDALPIDAQLTTLLDNPDALLPRFDASNPLQICQSVPDTSAFGARVGQICSFVDGMPDLAEAANTIQNLPTIVADRVCESIPGLNCGTDPVETVRQCRRQCYLAGAQCKLGCGVFGFGCRRECERRKDTCVDCCNTQDPGSCSFLALTGEVAAGAQGLSQSGSEEEAGEQASSIERATDEAP